MKYGQFCGLCVEELMIAVHNVCNLREERVFNAL